MRPVTLELEGFASFRDRTVVDFEGADLFVLSGPTGAGKSSLIDAMVFSLYGSVPRYDDRRLVHPVITQGHQQARVRFTFELDGERYAATRVVRRTRTGATTKEARLERLGDDAVVAGNADELSGAVEQLIGLRFEHFTRTVVLPQGEFQEFLHAKPKERQDLLVELLDLDVYRQVAQRARDRAKNAEATTALLRSRLAEDLADATEAALERARGHVRTLETLDRRCEELLPELERLIEIGREARGEATSAQERLAVVDALDGVPKGVQALADELQGAQEQLETARESHERATVARERADDALAGLPDPVLVQRTLDAARQRDELAAEGTRASERAQSAASELEAATTALEHADAAVAQREVRVRELEHRHLAHTLRAELEPGAPCPVCDHPVEAVPETELPEDLEAARSALAATREARDEARGQLATARDEATAARTAVGAIAARADEVSASLEVAVSGLDVAAEPDLLERLRDRIDAAKAACAAAREHEREAKSALTTARQRITALEERKGRAWRDLDAARDRAAGALSPATPPPLDRDDLAGAWRSLVAWVAEQRPAVVARAAAAQERIEEAEAGYRQRIDRLVEEVDARGIEVGDRDPGRIARAVGAALASARAASERAEERLEAATTATKQLEEAERDAAVASELGKLLNARNFEQWLLNRALQRLVAGASGILRDLTSDAYSLAVSEDGAFEVVDHRNADEVRSARTLSGGETFLASLSLALSLAEHVAELAAQGSARLEALFLDEGFGTLDADTLDTVAAAIEELGSKGRMVGVVTHVRDLAERIPIRYEVRRTGSTSTVERIER